MSVTTPASSKAMYCRECGTSTFLVLRSGDVVCSGDTCGAVYGTLRDRRRPERRKWPR